MVPVARQITIFGAFASTCRVSRLSQPCHVVVSDDCADAEDEDDEEDHGNAAVASAGTRSLTLTPQVPTV